MTKSLSMDPRDLRRNPWNSNIVGPENERKLDEAVKRFGFFKPIIVREKPDGTMEILGGQHRCEAAIRVGLDQVPVFNLGAIDDVRAKEISLADNARYGADDTLQLAQIMEEIGDVEGLQSYLPFSEAEITSIFSSVTIALEDLDIDDKASTAEETPEPAAAKTPKTHTVMRFKVGITDAERITELVARIQKRHGYIAADELTNAGDALVHLLLGAGTPEEEESDDETEDELADPDGFALDGLEDL